MMKLYVSFFLILSSLQVRAFELAPILTDKMYLHVKMEPSQKIIETEPLKKFYEPNGYQPYWTTNNRPNHAAEALRQVLKRADDWGLSSAQFMNKDLENLFDTVTDKNAITLEIMLTDAYLKFAQDLMNGQIVDPDLIDEDIKMPRKNFDVIPALAEAARRPDTMASMLESIAPQHPKYKELITVLKRLNELKARSAWGELVDPQIDLKPGAKHAVIIEIKKRLNDLGYPVANQSNVYDSDLQKAVARYQQLNSLTVTKTLSRSFFKSLAPTLQERTDKLKANLEKYRWFPLTWENRYLMVNLAFQEMRVVEDGRTVMTMKTVNGRPTRRTPTMRDEIRRVELSPTWTVPFSIAVKDKVPMLRENPYALNSMKIKFYDRHDNEFDPASVDWTQIDRTNFDFTLVQQPGVQNALGLVKFPLTNPWFIYLHDTNEHQLMGESDRFRSSGCVRLEDAFKLALYLLRDKPEWDMSQMKIVRPEPLPIKVSQPLPVYFLYQTVDVTPNGEIREVPDAYGQDQRLIELFRSRGSREKF